jgi:DNA-binding transcriptional ArsR family regulator
MNKVIAKNKVIEKCDDVSKMMKSLSHPVRLKILCQITSSDKTVCELAEFCEVSQSAMSQFLGRMREEGIIDSRKESTSVYYKICNSKVHKLMKAIYKIYC